MNITSKIAIAALAAAAVSCICPEKEPVNAIRPPAAPLVTVDPYFSIWSTADQVNMDATRHWTGHTHPLTGAIRVDGTSYRILGQEDPRYEAILPTIEYEAWDARYIMDKTPKGDWTARDYNDSSWGTAPGAFGTPELSYVRTLWGIDTKDIWVRRTFELEKSLEGENIVLEYSHDDVFELYVNGIKVVDTGNAWMQHQKITLTGEVLASLKPGKNTIAAHCHNTVGGAYVDFGLFRRHDDAAFEAIAEQKYVNVLPTRTIYGLECGGVEVTMTFAAPLFMDDLDLLSRPVNYLTFDVRATDGKKHDVQLYLEGTPKIAVDTGAPETVSTLGNADGIQFVRTGTTEQNILGKKGDNVRIDWGYFYLAAKEGNGTVAVKDYFQAKRDFMAEGTVVSGTEEIIEDNFYKDNVALCWSKNLGKVGESGKSSYIMLAYDDIMSIQYFGTDLRPYWNRNNDRTITSELAAAAKDYGKLMRRCRKFDREMMDEARAAGGEKYSEICALTYRQAIAAHKLVESPQGDLLWLSKENFSNGSIGTVDVTYPSAPMFLIYNPELCKGLLNHIFYYSESGKWDKPFAAHDVGTYPHANGQTYGGDMPVEECGNMLILTAAIAKVEGNAEYARKHQEVLNIWTDYLVEYGLDPENQLCTDDFAGHFAHNANLSIKAILGVASYAQLAETLGNAEEAAAYMDKAREMAGKWKEMAADGDHYRLTFDRPGTWSQKYNLVWDELLGLNVFDDDIQETELAFYMNMQNRYGLPLDSRRTYTKTDWITWTATMAEDEAVFEALIAPVWDYYNETLDRVPASDWVYTDKPYIAGFQARSVVGGFWIKMMDKRLNN